jgi:hypothetical protein
MGRVFVRPRSILIFERFYLASLACVLLQQVAGLYMASSLFSGLPRSSELGAGVFSGIIAGSMVVGLLFSIGLPLLFMWLASRRRSEVGKWALIVISALSILFFLFSLFALLSFPMPGFRTLQTVTLLIDGVAEGLGVVALWHLCRPEATEWFRTQSPQVSADIFR